MREATDEPLRDSEVAIVDAIKLIVEALAATGTVQGSVFEHIFGQQRDAYAAKGMPNAAVIMEVLRGFASRPVTVPHARAAIRAAMEKPPLGSA
jgi:hypothetical protein